MLENIRKCQVETLEWGDSDDENIPEKCTSIVDDDLESVDTPMSDVSSVSSVSSYSTDNEDDSQKKSTDYDKSSKFNDIDNANPKCRTCGGKCLVQLRTIIQNPKGELVPVYFCSIDCFEEEKFPEKFKINQFAARDERKAAKSKNNQ
jgi:hypothetical protein